MNTGLACIWKCRLLLGAQTFLCFVKYKGMWFFKTWNLSHVVFPWFFFRKIEPFEAQLLWSNNRLQSSKVNSFSRQCKTFLKKDWKKLSYLGQWRLPTSFFIMNVLYLLTYTLFGSISSCIGYTDSNNDYRLQNLVSLIPKESCSVERYAKRLTCVCKTTDTDVHFNFEVKTSMCFDIFFIWNSIWRFYFWQIHLTLHELDFTRVKVSSLISNLMKLKKLERSTFAFLHCIHQALSLCIQKLNCNLKRFDLKSKCWLKPPCHYCSKSSPDCNQSWLQYKTLWNKISIELNSN